MLDLINKSVIMIFVDREDKAMLRSNLSARSMPGDRQEHVSSYMLLSSCLSLGPKAINLLAGDKVPSKIKIRFYSQKVGNQDKVLFRKTFDPSSTVGVDCGKLSSYFTRVYENFWSERAKM